ncbi:MAG: helix-turn-helix domain-containing protein [Paludibacter sp.]|jgi:DNA-binding HxlR family transcriptional regulator
MEYKFRSECPITSALDILGDKWILVIIKLMLIQDKKTFKEFTESDEAIATNILASKLKYLEEVGIITKSQLPDNKKTNLYLLTEKGLALTPIIVELSVWSDENLREHNKIMKESPEIEIMKSDKAAFVKMKQKNYKAKIALITGLKDNSLK